MIDEKYKEHKIFSELSEYESFYKSLSFRVMGYVTFGTTGIINFDTYIFSSIEGTLESIRIILQNGRINDAYALLRKYYDSIMINIYAMLFLNNEINILTDGFAIENQINRWIHGKETLPGFGLLKQYIIRSDNLKAINGLTFDHDSRYADIRERCNGNTHYNLFYHVMLNDKDVHNEKRISILNQFSEDMRNLFIFHFVYTFFISGHYMASSDYVDHLDMGAVPPEGSENWVAPYIQSIFDSVIKPNRPDLAEALKSNTGMCLS